MLLADVFENFISTCLEYYGLVPCHYFSSPRLSWDAMLKMTEIDLELISVIDMYLFIEKKVRGGISYIAKRLSDGKIPSKFMYFDVNNLYGLSMSQYLPFGRCKG